MSSKIPVAKKRDNKASSINCHECMATIPTRLLSFESWQLAEKRMSQGWNDCDRRNLIANQFTASLQNYAAENWSSGECQ